MKGKGFFRNVNVSNVYAISLTPEKKRAMMGKIYTAANQSGILKDEQVRMMCNQLNQCFEVRWESISLAMEIIMKLLTTKVARDVTVQSYRKLLSYVSSSLEEESNCTSLACYLCRISSIALQDDTITTETFPVTVMKCILVLMYRRPISGLSQRKAVLQALNSTVQWCKRDLKAYKQCGIGTLLRSAIVSTEHLQDDLTAATELTVLAHNVMDVFYSPQTALLPVEVLLRLAYDHIFARLVREWSNAQCFELLLFVLYNMLKRDIYARLKLDILRILADAVGGGVRRLVRLLCVPKHLRDGTLLHKIKTLLTMVLSYGLFRYESQTRDKHFRAFLATIEQMIANVDLVEVVKARFLCFNFPRAILNLEHVCFVFILRHLDVVDGVTSASLELDYVYNLIATVNILYYKRWTVPSFLVKHLIDGLSRYSKTSTFEENVSEPEKKIEAILPATSKSGAVQKISSNMFGRLPVTVHRIQWLQLQPNDFTGQLIHFQMLEILQEYTILSTDDSRATMLRTVINVDTLVRVLASKQSGATARRNASLLLSNHILPGQVLKRVLGRIKRSCEKARTSSTDVGWANWVRAMYGSVHSLDSTSRRNLWRALSAIEEPSCSNEQRLLLVDTRACLLVDMIPEMKGKVVELHFHHPSKDKEAVSTGNP